MALRVLVTGASGFIGEALVTALVASGHRVRAASRQRANFPSGRVEWVQLPDLRGAVEWSSLLANVDVVVHLAGIAHRNGVHGDAIDRVNRGAVAALAAACQRHDVRRLIFMSSAGVHAGSTSKAAVIESHAPDPVTAYDRAKIAAERAVEDSGAPYTILRPVVVYGAAAKANFALAVRLARLSLPLPFGALEIRRSLLAIDNLIAAVIFCLDGEATLNQTFLVADPEAITVSAMFLELRRGLGRQPCLVPVPPAFFERLLRIVGRPDIWGRIGQEFVVDSTKLQNAGFRPLVLTEEGLRAVGAFYRTRRRAGCSSGQ
ncbi:NAD-dependent epimerase/dehydratase family protein [Tardiphaga sp. 804_B3_N1_9]|uniref:NAD-dependent epimerase/dehydratase family protein n=1 Tax=Tardiphaga TaxID=1395974 RepID=UPI001586A550|nr:NAD-dependent epimerase/dehydratase family protein [Tardiphaga robiniae]NUU41309.1 NAD-dependent epimerase/dehydratase family protein [Tardiphaga robiniae]